MCLLFRVSRLGFRVWALDLVLSVLELLLSIHEALLERGGAEGFRVWGLGFMIEFSLGRRAPRVEGLGFRLYGLSQLGPPRSSS